MENSLRKKFWGRLLSAALAALALTYVGWQLLGLRHTNHDDIFFELNSLIFSGNYIRFAENIAYEQARLQALINMPIILWANHFSSSIEFDALNIGAFAILYVAIVCALKSRMEATSAFVISAATLLLFPLHYYFSSPQGYPIMGLWGLSAALFSIALLDSHIKNPHPLKLIASATAFTISLWGPEYNFILHPALLLIVFINSSWTAKRIRPLVWPYAIGWVLSTSIYLCFSIISRRNGADADERVSFGFSLLAWLKTFFILEANSFLPIGLWRGISLSIPVAQGAPDIPTVLTYGSLWEVSADHSYLGLIFAIGAIAFYIFLKLQSLSPAATKRYIFFFLAAAVIPTLILSFSSRYQLTVLNGYLQGHLVSFYSQLGLAGTTFLTATAIFNRFSGSRWRFFIGIFLCSILSAFATTTLIYNNVNRQAMASNMQRWDAMAQLAAYIKAFESESGSTVKSIQAPAFWSNYGVSSIPAKNAVTRETYWTDYSKLKFGIQTKIVELAEGNEQSANAKYTSTPSGTPVVLYKNPAKRNHVLLASHPVEGFLAFEAFDKSQFEVKKADWKCSGQCIFEFHAPKEGAFEKITFHPHYAGHRSILGQFFSRRDGEYSRLSAIDIGELVDLKLVDWGPQSAVLNTPPNVQPDGNAGLWIRLTGTAPKGEFQILFDNKAALSTTRNGDLITASISADSFSTVGKKEIYARHLASGRKFLVGQINVAP